jgi:hypothetical protein
MKSMQSHSTSSSEDPRQIEGIRREIRGVGAKEEK